MKKILLALFALAVIGCSVQSFRILHANIFGDAAENPAAGDQANPSDDPFRFIVYGRILGTETWTTDTLESKPGDLVEITLGFTNLSPVTLDEVYVGFAGGNDLQLIPDSTSLLNGAHPEGEACPDSLNAPNGLNIGGYLGYEEMNSENGEGANAFISCLCMISEEADLTEAVYTAWAKSGETLLNSAITIKVVDGSEDAGDVSNADTGDDTGASDNNSASGATVNMPG